MNSFSSQGNSNLVNSLSENSFGCMTAAHFLISSNQFVSCTWSFQVFSCRLQHNKHIFLCRRNLPQKQLHITKLRRLCVASKVILFDSYFLSRTQHCHGNMVLMLPCWRHEQRAVELSEQFKQSKSCSKITLTHLLCQEYYVLIFPNCSVR